MAVVNLKHALIEWNDASFAATEKTIACFCEKSNDKQISPAAISEIFLAEFNPVLISYTITVSSPQIDSSMCNAPTFV